MLVDGKWSADWHPVQAKDEKGGFVRQGSSFRNWVTPDGAPGPTGMGGFAAEPGRYHLYVSFTCPWASRTLMARKLKKLDRVIGVSKAEIGMGTEGWRFSDCPGLDGTHVEGSFWLHRFYTHAAAKFTGRATVPILWDRKLRTIVNNESADILRMLDSGFGDLADHSVDLFPVALSDEIDALNAEIYSRLNNGVYRAGFATTQLAYEEAFHDVFGMLEALEVRLSDDRAYLLGERLTETDIRLFVTLARFDAVYHGIFKCNLRRIADYRFLNAYLLRLLAIPAIRETVDIHAIKAGYYGIETLNPTGIVPVGPELRWETLSKAQA